mgnify:CR=1 FL=1
MEQLLRATPRSWGPASAGLTLAFRGSAGLRPDRRRAHDRNAVATDPRLAACASGRIALVLVPTLWLWSVIASALFRALPSAFRQQPAERGRHRRSAETLFMISTWSEIPMALQLIQSGFSGPAAALLVVLLGDQPAVHDAARRIAAAVPPGGDAVGGRDDRGNRCGGDVPVAVTDGPFRILVDSGTSMRIIPSCLDVSSSSPSPVLAMCRSALRMLAPIV